MNTKRQKMNSALNEVVVTRLRELGFIGSIPHFRRINSNQIDLITFQFDKYGGGFVIEIAKTKNEPLKRASGEIIETNKITAWDIPDNIRIHPKGVIKKSSADKWFRYDKPVIGNRYQRVANQVLRNIDLIERIFCRNEL